MNIDKIIRKNKLEVVIDEKQIQFVIQESKQVFLLQDSKHILSYAEFVLNQFRMIRKRWWLFQFLILYLVWQVLSTEHEIFYIRRSMGILGTLFIILLLPELWKNITNSCMEIEISSFFSLRQIYATKIMLFGCVDILLLTLFSGSIYFVLNIPIVDIIIQFLLPMIVTACICFFVLCNKNQSKVIAMVSCSVWSGIWWLVVAHEKIYFAVAGPIWLFVFCLACCALLFTIYRFLKNCNSCLEGK